MTDGSRAGSSWATIRIPEGWDALDVAGADAVIAPLAPAEGFRPNAVLTSVDSDAPIQEASVAALVAATAENPGALVVACDVWPHAVHPGRRILFTYPAEGGAEVVVQKFVWATGRRHVHLTASCAVYQHLWLDQGFNAVATSIRFEEGS
ncbi:MAG: hypothetical protein ABWY55_07285 [Microbacterium sp.]